MIRATLIFLLLAAQARAAAIVVTVAGVRTDHGHVLVAICPRSEFLKPRCPWVGRAAARVGEVSVRIGDVPSGIYAAQAFHDADDNAKLERSFLGLPEEGMGFSNDAPMRFGPPSFDAASFAVGVGETAISFKLKYY